MISTASHTDKKQPRMQTHDDLIMNTNHSCIVSKRSVEKIYYKEDQGFLRHFVKKFQRRSPLINRGYWLRMKVIDRAVRNFLTEMPNVNKVIINLGCGYDTLPFKFLSHDASICGLVAFIDVDYHKIISSKCEIIKTTTKLSRLLTDVVDSYLDSEAVLLHSKHYSAVACNLQDVTRLDRVLKKLVNFDSALVLCLAEVSITYMDVIGADAIIEWASTLRQSQFCLLEQFLPDSHDHPFAQTMLRHFDKLRSPLKSPLRYHSLKNQEERFQRLGWGQVSARALWDYWTDNRWVSSEERRTLNNVEPFDEWEEFALFASHYLLLVAKTADQTGFDKLAPEISAFVHNDCASQSEVSGVQNTLSFAFRESPNGGGLRRYGATCTASKVHVLFCGGMGAQGRLHDCDTYAKTHEEPPKDASKTDSEPMRSTSGPAVMCHTITNLNATTSISVGGRTSPDCIRHTSSLLVQGKPCKDESMPFAVYRHCAVPVYSTNTKSKTSAVLVFGGMSDCGKISNHWLYWENELGWIELDSVGDNPCQRFGACMSLNPGSGNEGVLTGGLDNESKVITDFWVWTLLREDTVKVKCSNVVLDSIQAQEFQLGRFGAKMVNTMNGWLLIGGIAGIKMTSRHNEILKIEHLIDTENRQPGGSLSISRFSFPLTVPRPLLVGFAVELVEKNEIVLVGGGAVCFSFGMKWNHGCYTLLLKAKSIDHPWQLVMPSQIIAGSTGLSNHILSPGSRPKASPKHQQPTIVAQVQIISAKDFEKIVDQSHPVILAELHIGSCVDLWTNEYLTRQVGANRPVVVHHAETSTMNFLDKNFAYVTMPFGEMLTSIEGGEYIYMRSLSSSMPAEKTTSLSDDFPSIAADFRLPSELALVSVNTHSQPLRISGPVTMWLHYDVMANVLCQIRGSKKVVLFPPSDITELGFPPGASSSPLDVFSQDDIVRNVLDHTHPHEALLHPGDVLFIPALWAHAASPTDGVSIAVNVFFRSFTSGYSKGKDVYANRDVEMYETGRKNIRKMIDSFQNLPRDAGRFYLQRLAAELTAVAANWN